MIQNIKSAVIGTLLALHGTGALSGQEQPSLEKITATARDDTPKIGPTIKWVSQVSDRPLIEAISSSLSESLGVIGITEQVTIEFFNGAAVRGSVSDDCKVLLNRNAVRQLLEVIGASGGDKTTHGRVVGIYIAPTIAHELRHITDLKTLRRELGEPDLMIGGKELEALAFRCEGRAITNLIESGLWLEVEKIAETFPERLNALKKFNNFDLSSSYRQHLQRDLPLESIKEGLPNLYESYPSIFDRSAMLQRHKLPTEAEILAIRAAQKDKLDLIEAELRTMRATAGVLQDPEKFAKLLSSMQRIFDEDTKSIEQNRDSALTDLKRILIAKETANYAKRFREEYLPPEGTAAFVERIARVASLNAELLFKDESCVEFLQLQLDGFKTGLTTPPCKDSYMEPYLKLAKILNVPAEDRKAVITSAVQILEERKTNLEELSRKKIAGISNIADQELKDNSHRLKQFEKLRSGLE